MFNFFDFVYSLNVVERMVMRTAPPLGMPINCPASGTKTVFQVSLQVKLMLMI